LPELDLLGRSLADRSSHQYSNPALPGVNATSPRMQCVVASAFTLEPAILYPLS